MRDDQAPRYIGGQKAYSVRIPALGADQIRACFATDERGLQHDYAEQVLGVSSETLNRWLDGTVAIDRQNLERLLRLCGLPYRAIFGKRVPDVVKLNRARKEALVTVASMFLGAERTKESKKYRIYQSILENVCSSRIPYQHRFCVVGAEKLKVKRYAQIGLRAANDVIADELTISAIFFGAVRVALGSVIVTEKEFEVRPTLHDHRVIVERDTESLDEIQLSVWIGLTQPELVIESKSNVRFTAEVISVSKDWVEGMATLDRWF